MKKILLIIVSIFVLSMITFAMARLAPGDPLVSYYGDRVERMSMEERQHAIERLGLDGSIPEQYVDWLKSALHGDFGISFKYKQDVMTVISGRLLNTLLLGGIGFLLTFAFALLLAVLCAYKENTLLDRVICKVGTITSCIPEFWLSLVLILLFGVTWHLLPSSGAYALGMSGSIASRAVHLILPLTVVVLSHLWYYAYMLRNKLLDETRQEYVLLARAKGLRRRQVMWRHCVRNLIPTLISIMAISVNHIIEGTYIVEMVFSYPGIGTLCFESAKYHDYNMLMILVIITGVIVIVGNVLGQAVSEHIDRRLEAPGELMEVQDERSV
ncbi:MAG: ABC transporter permease [Bacillota bacterium]|nr:ABC transporter permease [Bacillota bacterium]